MSKKTMVIGASTNPDRYSYMAIHRLVAAGHEVIPVGVKKGEVSGIPIINDLPLVEDVDTVTLYIGAKIQQSYEKYILDLKPKRVIFNPGTFNQPFMDKLQENGIEVQPACTLVMLSNGLY